MYAYDATTSAYIGAATMGAGGAYTIDLPAGSYKLFVEPNTAGLRQPVVRGSNYASATVIAVSAATAQDITLVSTFTLSGTVAGERRDDRPHWDLRVRLRRHDVRLRRGGHDGRRRGLHDRPPRG